MMRDRTERMSHALRRRPLGVVDAPADAPATGAGRHVLNTTRDSLVPDLERMLAGDEAGSPSSGPRSRLLEHLEATLLYYSTAIIAAGDSAARYVALSKLREPGG